MSLDLHTHTTFSDGTTTPETNAALAAAAGLDGLALTDHDTTDGWEQAAGACAARGLTFVPGLELSTELHGRSVHVLGYWVDRAHPELVAECERLRNERERRAQRMLELLGGHGIDVSWERVQFHAGVAPIGRPHVAAALVETGAVADVQEAFALWLADGGRAYVPKHALPPPDGVRLIVGAGGVAVLAHPGLSGAVDGERQARIDEALLDELVAAGLAGVEADHAGHEEDTAAYWRKLADARGLAVTGSSDFHGDNKAVMIGARTTPREVVEALRARATGAREGSW